MMLKKPELSLLTDELAVCRLPKDAAFPEWIAPGKLAAIVRTEDELSIVCLQEFVPDSIKREAGWRCLKVQGPLDFSQVGILASIALPLAESGISIFAISTYDTDYILLKETKLELALHVLTQAGFGVTTDESIFA